MMNPVICVNCESFEFEACGSRFPCDKLLAEINIKGTAYKPYNNNDPVTKNTEAKFIPLDKNNPEKFLFTTFTLAKRIHLTPVTFSEFILLSRQLKDEDHKSITIKESDSDFILVTENWAQEIRSILKFILRLHTLDFDLPFHYIERTAKKVNPLLPLKFDKRKSRF